MQYEHFVRVVTQSQDDTVFSEVAIWLDVFKLLEADLDGHGLVFHVVLTVFPEANQSEHPLLLGATEYRMQIIDDSNAALFQCIDVLIELSAAIFVRMGEHPLFCLRKSLHEVVHPRPVDVPCFGMVLVVLEGEVASLVV